MKHIKMMFFVVFFIVMLTLPSFAFSQNWFKDGNNWRIKDGSGNVITNAWLCDDTESSKPWYLLDSNGNIVVGLAQDHGSWYFLGSDGKLKTTSGYYDGVYLNIDSSGAIKNLEYIAFLIAKYGNCSVTNTTGSIYANSFSSNPNSSLSSSTGLTPHDGDDSVNDRIIHVEDINACIEQALGEFDSSYLQYNAGIGITPTMVLDIASGCGLIVMTGQPITLTFIDSTTGARQFLRINTTPKNIKWAINKLRR